MLCLLHRLLNDRSTLIEFILIQPVSAGRTASLLGGEGQIQLALLLRLWDPVAPLVLILRTRVRKASLFGFISRL